MIDLDSFAVRLEQRDPALFSAVPSLTAAADRESLLALQASVRRGGPYVYLEIGSHLGGTLQTHCADPRCRRIYSIDKRPALTDDIRGFQFEYKDGSTAQMLAGLRAALGPAVDKIVTFDSDAASVPPGGIADSPQLCFIDGEHTFAAARSDFRFCLKVTGGEGIIAFHDAHLLHSALAACRRELESTGIVFRELKLSGSVFAFLLGSAVSHHGADLGSLAKGAFWFRVAAPLHLTTQRIRYGGHRMGREICRAVRISAHATCYWTGRVWRRLRRSV